MAGLHTGGVRKRPQSLSFSYLIVFSVAVILRY